MKWLVTLALTGLAAGFVGTGMAQAVSPAKKPGSLEVIDSAGFFTSGGIQRARSLLTQVDFPGGLKVTVDTYPDASKGGNLPKDADNATKQRFFSNWAHKEVEANKDRGIYILICKSPGYVEILVDRETRNRGFTQQDQDRLRKILTDALASAAKTERGGDPEKAKSLRDQGLYEAISFIENDLKDTSVAGNARTASSTDQGEGIKLGSGIGGWLCLGLMILLGVWLVVGVFRALMGGFGGGPGMGGGGFFSSLLGGLFGAAAGMWLYDHFFGGSSGMFGGSDAYANDGTSATDTGAGDFSGDDGTGGGFDDGGGDFGGGDFGGGDFGGGDFGGDF